MFKKIVVSFIIAAMLIASVPSEARGGFGGGGRSSSFSSSRSSSSFGSSAPRVTAPVAASRPMAVAPPTGGMSRGGNVGMQRPAVTNSVRTPTPTPTYNSSASYGSAYRPVYSSGNHQSYSSHTTVVHHYSPSTGGGGFGMGSLAMAAMGGYMLNGIMHEHSGAVYNGAGYTNGVPTQGGQYYTQPQVGDVQQQVQQPQSQQQAQAQEQMQQQPQIVYQQVPVESGMPTWVKILLWMFGITVIIALIRRIFI